MLKTIIRWAISVLGVFLCAIMAFTSASYPCTSGAGLALADMGVALVLIFVGFPVLAIAIQLLKRMGMPAISLPAKAARLLGWAMLCWLAVYCFLAMPILFHVQPHPLSFVCHSFGK